MKLILFGKKKKVYDLAGENLTNCIIWQEGVREEGFLPHPSPLGERAGGVPKYPQFLQVFKINASSSFQIPQHSTLKFYQLMHQSGQLTSSFAHLFTHIYQVLLVDQVRTRRYSGKEHKSSEHPKGLIYCVASQSVLVTQSCLTATPWTVAPQAPLSMEFSRQEYWRGCHSLLQGIFLIQESNLGLLPCRQDSLPSEPPGKPIEQISIY